MGYRTEEEKRGVEQLERGQVLGCVAGMVEKLARIGLDAPESVRTKLFNAQTTLEAVYRELKGSTK